MLLWKLVVPRATNDAAPARLPALPSAPRVRLHGEGDRVLLEVGSEKSICFRRSSVLNIEAMITSTLPRDQRRDEPREVLIDEANLDADVRAEPPGELDVEARQLVVLHRGGRKAAARRPHDQRAAVSPPSAGPGIVWSRFVIQRSTMSAHTPFWRISWRNVLNAVRGSASVFRNPAATGDLKIGLRRASPGRGSAASPR